MVRLTALAGLTLAWLATANAADTPPAAPEPAAAPATAPAAEPAGEAAGPEAAALAPRQFIMFFDPGEIPTTADADPMLPQIAEIFRRVGYTKIDIECHSDKYATPEEGIKISTERAEFIKTTLVLYGLPGEAITARGVGFEDPMVPGLTPDEAVSNRRCLINLT